MTTEEEDILSAENPAEYIEASFRSRLCPADKARLSRLWMEKTGYTRADILYARNRHPYWRREKMEGAALRTRDRLASHNYSKGGSIRWTRDRIEAYLDFDVPRKAGGYEKKDWEVALHFGTSIPSIQYMRRKIRKAKALLDGRAARETLVAYLLCAESVLSQGALAARKAAAAKGSPARKSRIFC